MTSHDSTVARRTPRWPFRIGSLLLAMIAGGSFVFGVMNTSASPTIGQEEQIQFADPTLGAFYSRDIWAFYDIPIEVDGAGNLRGKQRVRDTRSLFAVPKFFGELIDITQHGDRAVFWYRDKHGEIRNVVIDKVDSRAMRIEQRAVEKLRFEVVR